MSKYSIDVAVRMVGNLLKYHPTTDYYAKDKFGTYVELTHRQASCFCYVGAMIIVAKKLHTGTTKLERECEKALRQKVYSSSWDTAADYQRAAWANKLANYKV